MAGDDRDDPPLPRANPTLWALVALVPAALVALAVVALVRAERGPRPRFLTEPSASASPAPPPPAPDGPLGLAGSGSNLPLTRALVEAYRAAHPGARLVVHESIGSTGGTRAVRDGVIGVALISRPLNAEESRHGLVVRPYARVAVVAAANPNVADTCVGRAELVALFTGERTRWSDGSRAVLFQRERGDSSFLAMAAAVPGLAAANDAAYRADRFRVLYHDRAMQDALVATDGAVGIFDGGAIEAQRLPLKILCLDGVVPTREAVLSGRWPITKDLAFVTNGPPSGPAADLLAFVASPAGRAVIDGLGYLALPLAGPPDGGSP
jgi:phosphate transport system substrate-binding protein